MRDARWIPEESQQPIYERPRLHAPSPYGEWLEDPQAADAAEDEEQPRVIIIDM